MRPLGLVVLSASVLLAACAGGGGDKTDAATANGGASSNTSQAGAVALTTSTLDSPHSGGPPPQAQLITSFELPPSVSCDGDAGTVTATYATTAETVAFLVDQRTVAEPPAPTSGTYQLSLPCDGATHTVVLVAVVPGGQQLATRAVQMRRPA
jgi:hypothetical protein